MHSAGFAAPPLQDAIELEAKITPVVIIYSIMVASGGLVFGYDVGISGNLG